MRLFTLIFLVLALYGGTARSQCFTFTVVACIDGRSLLHISGNQLWWQHLNFDPPGTHSNCPGPVTVNGVVWSPWNSPFILPNTTTGCSLVANVLQCSYICNVIQAPTAANNWEAIYDFDDNAPGGPHMFTIQLQYFCPTIDAGADQAVCAGTGANLNATGGATYAWAPPDGLSCTNCPNPTASPLVTTTYTVTATDVNGCSASDAVTVTILPAPVVSFTAQNACLGNVVNITNNTTGNITAWNWDFGNTQTGVQQNPAPVGYAATGIYTITLNATSDLGCAGSSQQVVNIFEDPAGGAVSSDAGCASATNGMVDLSMTAGTAPYQFSWNNGQTGEDLQNISQGIYDVIFTDANGCTGTASATVGLSPPLGVALTAADFNGFNITCYGGSNGAIDLTATNGVQPNGFLWSNNSASEDLSGLSTGNYSVTITDAAGCTINGSIALTEPPALSVSSIGISPVCFGGDDGTAAATASGGISPYQFTWSNVSSGDSIDSLTAGDYSISATDVNGCVAETTITIQDPPHVEVSIQPAGDTIPFFGQSVQLTTVVQNATGVGVYSWQPATGLSCTACTAPVAAPVATTVYTLYYVDDNGCEDTAEVTVFVNRDKLFFAPTAFSPNSDGVNDVFHVFSFGVADVDVIVFNRWGEKLYAWSGLDDGWDGTYKDVTVDVGVYAYVAQLHWLDGEVRLEKGTVTVIK